MEIKLPFAIAVTNISETFTVHSTAVTSGGTECEVWTWHKLQILTKILPLHVQSDAHRGSTTASASHNSAAAKSMPLAFGAKTDYSLTSALPDGQTIASIRMQTLPTQRRRAWLLREFSPTPFSVTRGYEKWRVKALYSRQKYWHGILRTSTRKPEEQLLKAVVKNTF